MNYYFDVWKKYVEFNGRSRRQEYWMFVLINLIVTILINILGSMLHFSLMSVLYAIAIIIPSLAVAVRRLHDTGRTGWWILIGIIPIIGWIILLVFAVLDSQPGDNKYGPNPKGVGGAAVQQ